MNHLSFSALAVDGSGEIPGRPVVPVCASGWKPRWMTRWIDEDVHGRDPRDLPHLWNTVQTFEIEKSSMSWAAAGSSTIHRPYHHYKSFMTRNPKEEVGTT